MQPPQRSVSIVNTVGLTTVGWKPLLSDNQVKLANMYRTQLEYTPDLVVLIGAAWYVQFETRLCFRLQVSISVLCCVQCTTPFSQGLVAFDL